MTGRPGYGPARHCAGFREAISRCVVASLLAAFAAGAGAGDLPKTLAALEASRLQLASVHAAVADIGSDTTLYRKNADRTVPIASVTKLMTALVVLDSGRPLDEWLTVPERHEEPPNNGYSRIRIGSRLRRGDLVHISLIASENLAAYTLARHHPGGFEAFIAAMNDKAEALGMHNTTFVDPSGLSESNRSTAVDLMKLVRSVLGNETIRTYTRTGGFTARFRGPRYNLRYGNTNALVHRDAWDVALTKTGYLDTAGRCLVMVAEIGDRQIAMVLLDSFGTHTPLGDAGRIRDWIETGAGGSVAGPALEYERQKSAAYRRADNAG